MDHELKMGQQISKYHSFLIGIKRKSEQNSTFHYGGVVFKKSVIIDNFLEYIDRSKVETLKSSVWNIQNIQQAKFQAQKWPQILAYIIEARCEVLYIAKNQFPLIIHTITIQQWSKMRFLNLKNNQITNIEAIAFVEMPEIKQIDFGENHVTQLKPLVKFRWKKLSAIFATKNNYQQITLSRINFLTEATIDIRFFESRRDQQERITVHSKLQIRNSTDLKQFIGSRKKNVHKSLCRKYKINF